MLSKLCKILAEIALSFVACATSASAAPNADFLSWCKSAINSSDDTSIIKQFNIRKTTDCSVIYAEMSQQKSLDLAFRPITDLTFLKYFPQLEELQLNGTRTKDLSPVSALKHLRILVLNSRNVNNIDALSHLSALEELTLDGSFVDSLAPLGKLTNLKRLFFRQGPKLRDISALKNLDQLQTLYLQSELVKDFSVISQLKTLEDLQVGGPYLNDLSFLASLTKVHSLMLQSKKVLDLSAVAKISGLKSLHIEYSGLTTIAPLSALKDLRELYIGFNKISDLSPLEQLTQLQTLRISENPVRSLAPIAMLPLTHLEVMTATIKKTDDACPINSQVNPLVKKFCKRLRKI